MDPNEHNQERTFWREFLCLWTLAVAVGALSSLLTHFPPAGLERLLLIPFHSQSTRALLIALVAQNSIHLAIAVGVGLVAAHRVGLGAPVLEAWLRGEPVGPYVHAPVRPILLTVLLVVACTTLSNASMLHPNRQQDAIMATELANSPARAKLDEQLDKLGLVSTPYTGTSLAISYLDRAIDGELNARLFELSVIILLFVQIFGRPKTIAEAKFFWVAILIVALIHTTYNLWARHENTLMISEVFRGLGLQLRVDPYWLVAARASIPIFPPSLAFGWLYSRYGIESAIVAGFAGAIITPWFIELWLSHLPL
jgi:hypothetical protein